VFGRGQLPPVAAHRGLVAVDPGDAPEARRRGGRIRVVKDPDDPAGTPTHVSAAVVDQPPRITSAERVGHVALRALRALRGLPGSRGVRVMSMNFRSSTATISAMLRSRITSTTPFSTRCHDVVSFGGVGAGRGGNAPSCRAMSSCAA